MAQTHTRQRAPHRNAAQCGAALIYLIMATVVMGILGGAMVSMYSSSTQSTAMPDNAKRARYMAESGIRYALGQMRNVPAGETLSQTIQRLNDTTFAVDAGGFTVNVFSILSFESPYDQHVNTSGNMVLRASNKADVPEGYSLPVINNPTDGLYLVNEKEIGLNPNDQEVVRITSVTSTPGGVTFDVAVQGSNHPLMGDVLMIAVKPTSNQNISQGGSLNVSWGAQIFPEYDGRILIAGRPFQYSSRVDNGNGYTLVGLSKPYGLVWGTEDNLNNIGNDDYIVFDSSDNGYYTITADGFWGTGTMLASASQYINEQVQGSATGSGGSAGSAAFVSGTGTATYADDQGDTVQMAFTNPDNSYTGAVTDGGATLGDANLADVDTGLALESGSLNPGGDALSVSARYGQNNVNNGDFYADYGDYEIAIKTGASSVVMSADFQYTSGDWCDFTLRYNTAGDNKLLWRFGNAGNGYVQQESVALNPPTGFDRFLSNFYILTKGRYQNANRYFQASVRNVQVQFDGTAWPASGSLPDITAGNSDADYYYLLSQRDTASTSLEVTGEFQLQWDSITGSDYGVHITLYLHDVPQ